MEFEQYEIVLQYTYIVDKGNIAAVEKSNIAVSFYPKSYHSKQ